MSLHQDELHWLWKLCHEYKEHRDCEEREANWDSLLSEAEKGIDTSTKEVHGMADSVTYYMQPTILEKEQHLQRGERIVKELAKRLGLKGKVRRNPGGPAVMGEVAFVGDGVRIELTGLRIEPAGEDLMFRTERGDRFSDYGVNHWLNSRWVEKWMEEAVVVMVQKLGLK